jgi:hypothetical protein
VFFSILAKVTPQVIRQCVFRLRLCFQNAVKLRAVIGKFRKHEVAPLTESDNENPFAMLWDDTTRVDNLVINRIAECAGKRPVNDVECAAMVVAFQVLHVLEDKRRGTVKVDNVSYREEEVALLQIIETVFTAEA